MNIPNLVEIGDKKYARFRMHWWKIIWGGSPYYFIGPILGFIFHAPIMYWVGLGLALTSRIIVDIVEIFFETFRPRDAKYRAKKAEKRLRREEHSDDLP